METVFVTYLLNGAEWVKSLGVFEDDIQVVMALPTIIPECLRVIGHISIDKVAEVIKKGGEYWHFRINDDDEGELHDDHLPTEEFSRYGAKITRYHCVKQTSPERAKRYVSRRQARGRMGVQV